MARNATSTRPSLGWQSISLAKMILYIFLALDVLCSLAELWWLSQDKCQAAYIFGRLASELSEITQ